MLSCALGSGHCLKLDSTSQITSWIMLGKKKQGNRFGQLGNGASGMGIDDSKYSVTLGNGAEARLVRSAEKRSLSVDLTSDANRWRLAEARMLAIRRPWTKLDECGPGVVTVGSSSD